VAVEESQILHVPSWLAETMSEPSQLKLTDVTGMEWAQIAWRHLLVFTSHIRTVSSKDPDTIRFNCGLKFTQNTKSECPRRVFTCADHHTYIMFLICWLKYVSSIVILLGSLRSMLSKTGESFPCLLNFLF
jgi:hypothetical protein